MLSSKRLVAARSRILSSTVVERVDADGRVVSPRGPKWLVVAVNQALAERGVRAPWVASRDECQRFWTTRIDDSNAPVTYAEKDMAVVDFLHGFWSPEVSTEHTVLELGCNAGTNLERLRQLGFTKLQGLEINPTALDYLRGSRPELAEIATLRLGTIEDTLSEMSDDATEVVFTMAVLIHVHPSSHKVLVDMVRVARRHLCVLELETAANAYVFSRNYRRVFERLGCTHLRSTQITPETHPEVAREYDGYIARLFTVPTGRVSRRRKSPRTHV